LESPRVRAGTDGQRGAAAALSAELLDDAVAARARVFMRQVGLFAARLDLAVDRKRQVWFRACHPDGPWSWLDDRADGAITRAFADGLVRRLRAVPVIPGVAAAGMAR